jgi:hypothetical protein
MLRLPANRLRVIYGVTTTLFLLLQAWATWQYFAEAPRMTDTILALGYPKYVMKILGVAKLLGILAIATGMSPTLKEWAYAGFTFDVCGAFASHLSAGDPPLIALVPASFLVVQLASYMCWKQLRQRREQRRRREAFGLARDAAGGHA